ncbi:MAG: hypothetical protein D4R65_10020 [Verrucomicrobiaceae bacterium]|nr:MAG: hypothetical protein D4R65_10020 [Verrucomicrobiaceae bacterium]
MRKKQQETTTLTQLVFCLCVTLLELTAAALNPVWPGGMDYVKINVLLFCILLPVVLVGSLALNAYLLWTR